MQRGGGGGGGREVPGGMDEYEKMLAAFERGELQPTAAKVARKPNQDPQQAQAASSSSSRDTEAREAAAPSQTRASASKVQGEGLKSKEDDAGSGGQRPSMPPVEFPHSQALGGSVFEHGDQRSRGFGLSPEGQLNTNPALQTEALQRLSASGIARVKSSKGKSLFAAQFDSVFGERAKKPGSRPGRGTAPQGRSRARPSAGVANIASHGTPHMRPFSGGARAQPSPQEAMPASGMRAEEMSAEERAAALAEVRALLGPEVFERAQQRVRGKLEAEGKLPRRSEAREPAGTIEAKPSTDDREGAAGTEGTEAAKVQPQQQTELVARKARGAETDAAAGTKEKDTQSAETSLVTAEGGAVDESLLEKLPFTPEATWLNMNIVETDKLQWMMGDLDSEADNEDDKHQVRFDFTGSVVAEDADVSTKTGLYHHGRAQSRPGYTLAELLEMARSSVPAQRVIGLRTLTRIIARAVNGEYAGQTQTSHDSGTILMSLVRMGVTLYLRKALDEDNVSVCALAAQGISRLLSFPAHERLLEAVAASPLAHSVVPLRPMHRPIASSSEGAAGLVAGVEEDEADVASGPHKGVGAGGEERGNKDVALPPEPETDEEDVANEDEEEGLHIGASTTAPTPSARLAAGDGEVGEATSDERLTVQGQQRLIKWAARDVCRAMVDMDLLLRIRYLIEVAQVPALFDPALTITIRVARHSARSALRVLETPRLVATVIRMFVRCEADAFETKQAKDAAPQLKEKAVRLLRVLCQAHRATATQLRPLLLKEMIPAAVLGNVQHAGARAELLRCFAVYLRYDMGANILTEHFTALLQLLRGLFAKQDYAACIAVLQCVQSGVAIAANNSGRSPNTAVHWPALLPFVELATTIAVRLVEDATAARGHGDGTRQEDEGDAARVDGDDSGEEDVSAQQLLLAACLGVLSAYVSRGGFKVEEGSASPMERIATSVLRPLLSSPTLLPNAVDTVCTHVDLFSACAHSTVFNPVFVTSAAVGRALRMVAAAALVQSIARATTALFGADKSVCKERPPLLSLLPRLLSCVINARSRHLQLHVVHRHAVAAVEECIHLAVAGDWLRSLDIPPSHHLALLSRFPPGQESTAKRFLSDVVVPLCNPPAAVVASITATLAAAVLHPSRVASAATAALDGDPGARSSMVVPRMSHDATVLPIRADWMYWPLLSSVEVLRSLPEEAAAQEEVVAPIRHDLVLSLNFLHSLMREMPEHMHTRISASRRLSSLLRLLCCPGQMYLDKLAAKALTTAFSDIRRCSPAVDAAFGVGTRAEVAVLVQVFVDVLEEYVTASYGSEVVGLALLKGFARGFPATLTSYCLGNERFADMCDIEQSTMAADAEAYLLPLHTDRHVLDLFITSLHLRQFERDSFVYRLSVHHTAAFIFSDFGKHGQEAEKAFEGDKHASRHRVHATRRMVLAMPDDVLADVLRYTADLVADRFVSFPLEGEIPTPRLTALRQLPKQDAQYRAALEHKHLLPPHLQQ